MHPILDARWHQPLGWLAQQGMALEPPPLPRRRRWGDGTGVGYAVPFEARFARGQSCGSGVRA
ncbi:MAG: hypothetical protein NZ874_07860 [Fimbriimonadales bacterium]|nr:hypothetical protein [Fimbriimonadales bacterium]